MPGAQPVPGAQLRKLNRSAAGAQLRFFCRRANALSMLNSSKKSPLLILLFSTFFRMSANSSDNSSIIQEKIDTHMVGSLTLLMPFLPTILAYIGLICISRKRVDQMASGMTKLEFFLIPLLFLPGVQILTNTPFSILVSGSLIKDFFDMDFTGYWLKEILE